MNKPSIYKTDISEPEYAFYHTLLKRLVNVEAPELKALFFSFAYFFCLLCSYYIIRPIRDEMGILGGVDKLQWLFTGTFLVMLAVIPLFGWVSSRYPRKRFLPYVYCFVILNLLCFFFLFKSDITHTHIARIFFIWTSVFNLFVVSVFWSFMADIFDNNQAKRLFGFIAAGGTAGAIIGPILTSNLAIYLGPTNLLLLSAVFLAISILCIRQLISWKETTNGVPKASESTTDELQAYSNDKPMGGSVFAGFRLVISSPYLLGICALIVLFTTLSTFLYFQQAQIIKDAFSDSAKRTAVFAGIDLAVNTLTIIIQVFLTGRIVKTLGLGWTLSLVPVILCVGFVVLGINSILSVLILVQVIRRAGNYSIMKPAREMLYTVLDREEKYKAKNFIDTAIYRGGDAVSAWAYTGLIALGLSLSSIAFIAVPITLLWAFVSFTLGKRREEMAQGSG